MNGVLFCTSAFEAQGLGRTAAWVKHYEGIASVLGLEMRVYNDGPSPVRYIGPAEVFDYYRALGRPMVGLHYGWRRSFLRALAESRDEITVVHIESDCFIRRRAFSKLVKEISTSGFRTGWSRRYRWAETGLMVMNDANTRDRILDLYRDGRRLMHETRDFEKVIEQEIGVTARISLTGDRWEGDDSYFEEHHDYVANVDYDNFLRLDAGGDKGQLYKKLRRLWRWLY
jgi:hypothetical protein